MSTPEIERTDKKPLPKLYANSTEKDLTDLAGRRIVPTSPIDGDAESSIH